MKKLKNSRQIILMRRLLFGILTGIVANPLIGMKPMTRELLREL